MDEAGHIAVMEIELHIPHATSLKAKRSVIKSLKDRTRKSFNVSIAEVAHLDKWQRSIIMLVMVSNEAGYLEGQMEKVKAFIEGEILGSAYIVRLEKSIH